MHGKINPHESRLSEQAIDHEKRLLRDGVKALVKPHNPASGVLSQAQRDALEDVIIKKMTTEIEETGGVVSPDNPGLPCAYTYFGQLVAHDITSHRFLGAPLPSLRLQTLYGMGPTASPQFFQHSRDPRSGHTFRGVKFSLEKYTLSQPKSQEQVYDFQRTNLITSEDQSERDSGVPLMADARNDQNFIISQMTVLFERLHNLLADRCFSKDKTAGQMFSEASKELIDLYQRVLVTDYLPRILFDGKALVEGLIKKDKFLIFSGEKGECRLSEVFSRAALRYGHTQVRQMYQVQMNRGLVHLFGTDFDLRGFTRDTRRKIDWACLLAEKKPRAFQPAKAFDTDIVLTLNNLPFFPGGKRSLIEKNLENSLLNFTVGQTFRDKLEAEGLKDLKEKLAEHPVDTTGWDAEGEVPLWVYLLLEAHQCCDGKTLGPLGSQIVAEQIIWALKDDRESVLGSRGTTLPEHLSLCELMQMADPAIAGHLQTLEAMAAERNARSVVIPAKKSASTQGADLLPPAEPPTTNRFYYAGTEVGLTYREKPNGQIEQQKTDNTWTRVSLTDKPNPGGYNFVSERANLLQNGFHWYPSTESEDSIREQIEDGTLPHHSKKKREIRVYFSRDMILRHCANPAPAFAGNANIKGLFFIFARKVADDSLFLLARPTGAQGEAVLINDAYPWDSTDATITVTNANASGFSNDFVANQYAVFKDNGLVPQTIALAKLLQLMGYSQTDADTAAGTKTVEISLISVQGEDLARGENYGLAPLGESPEDDDYRSTTFFALAMKSGSAQAENVLITGSGRPYPPNCYVMFAVWQ